MKQKTEQEQYYAQLNKRLARRKKRRETVVKHLWKLPDYMMAAIVIAICAIGAVLGLWLLSGLVVWSGNKFLGNKPCNHRPYEHVCSFVEPRRIIATNGVWFGDGSGYATNVRVMSNVWYTNKFFPSVVSNRITTTEEEAVQHINEHWYRQAFGDSTRGSH